VENVHSVFFIMKKYR